MGSRCEGREGVVAPGGAGWRRVAASGGQAAVQGREAVRDAGGPAPVFTLWRALPFRWADFRPESAPAVSRTPGGRRPAGRGPGQPGAGPGTRAGGPVWFTPGGRAQGSLAGVRQ